jgi:hypothetical protein
MPYNIEYLAAVPIDILRDIVQELDAVSATELMKLCESNPRYRSVGLECKRRLSVPLYLSQTFGDSKKLLRAMAACDAYIWGGKALGFYVTNKLSDSLTWNISVPRHSPQVAVLMRALEDMGVVWRTAIDDVRVIFEKGKGEVIMDSQKYRRYTEEIHNVAIQEYGYYVDLSIHIDLSARIQISVNDKRVWVENPGFHHDSFTRRCDWTCTGVLKRPDFTDRIRIGGEEFGCMDAMINSHSSCMQAFISPHVSVHLYGKLACAMSTYGWHERLQLQTGGGAIAWDTIRRCGFKYRSASTSTRIGTDNESVVVPYTDACDIPLDVSSADAMFYTSIRWEQKSGGLTSLTMPYVRGVRERRELAEELCKTFDYHIDKHLSYLNKYVPWIR